VTTSKTPLVRKPNKYFNATTINSPKNNEKINIQSGQEVLETIFEKARRDRDTAVKELKKMVDRDFSVDKDQRPLKRH
jgi:translation initiation factor 2 beta subunit (eIF-2beta)/eIF-5